MKPYIAEILLKDFRNHALYEATFNSRHVLFCGKNGAGKTSILEAISKLSPGLGIRSAKNSEIIRIGASSWEVSLKFASDTHLTDIGMGYSSEKRITKVNRDPVSSFGEVLNLIKVMWFTPQMGNVFITDKAVRRKFFDRLVALSDPKHLDNLILYERFKSERQKLLATRSSNMWLDVVEKQVAGLCINVNNSRERFIQLLSNYSPSSSFGSPEVRLLCSVADEINNAVPTQEAQLEAILRSLCANREKDVITGKMQFGVHRADFLVTKKEAENAARNCSTGEQKSLILSILLAASELVDIMLLDDIFAHLDQRNLTLFLEEAMQRDCQFFFSDLEGSKVAPFNDVIHVVSV